MPYHDVEFEVRDPDGYIVVVSEWIQPADDVPDAIGEHAGEHNG